ncbi:hypothetical protein H4R33_006160 [Dimargaris cristalligena]|nr:hypothetical protein H4R33_006160 [Dimargaris cristalligena]
MSLHDKPLIAVVGATGAQGGSVVDALIDTMQFNIRGLTRNPQSEHSLKLARRGVEMVKCNLNNRDELAQAFQGAYGLFATTNFWQQEIMENPAVEIQQGKNIADAAKQAGIQHLVLSSLPDANKISGGKYHDLHHFNNKAQIEYYVKSLEIPTTVVNFGYYMSNWSNNPDQFRKRSDGDYEVNLPVSPDTQVPPIDAVVDGGHCVVHCFRNPQETMGQSYDLACGYSTLGQMIDTLAKVGGKKIHINVLTPEEAAKHSIYGIPEIYKMYQYIVEFGYFGGRGLERSLDIFGVFNSFEDFLYHHNWKLA